VCKREREGRGTRERRRERASERERRERERETWRPSLESWRWNTFSSIVPVVKNLT